MNKTTCPYCMQENDVEQEGHVTCAHCEKEYEATLITASKPIEDVDALPKQYETLARMLGIETTMKLANEYKGKAVYFPLLEKGARRRNEKKQIRNKQIHEAFTGKNYAEIAVQFNLTESRVRQIVKGVNVSA